MSNTLVIVGHPDLNDASIANRIIVDRLADMDGVETRVLHSLYPDLKIDVEAEQQALLGADTVVLQFPLHWYSVPALLKQWLDQVLTYGFAYGARGTKLHGKRLLLSITVGGPEEAYGRGTESTYSIEEFLYPLRQTAKFIGMSYESPVVTHSMMYIPDVFNAREAVEERARQHAKRLVDRIRECVAVAG